LDVHEEHMEYYYKNGIVLDDTLVWNFNENPIVSVHGKIFVGNGICISVKKFLRIFNSGRGHPFIKTTHYSYNVNYDGIPRSEIFRYDNFHGDHPHKGHKGPHHYHVFNPPNKQIRNSPFELAEDEVPTLGDVIG
jgi:hypothetical protein